MQRTTKIINLFVAGLFATMATTSIAQVGPYPTDVPQQIPLVDQSTIAPQSTTPSASQTARPVIDAMLQSAASEFRPAQPVSSSASNSSVERDVRSQTSSMPIGKPASLPDRTTLIGADESQTGSPIIDKGYIQTIAALAGVILLILGLGQVYKRLARSQGGLAGQLGAGGSAPSGIIEVVGRYPISKGMTLVVLKFDRRVLLLSHASPTKGKNGQAGTMQVLSELSDPEDIASILLKTRGASGDLIAQSFEQSLREADELTDDHLHGIERGNSEVNPVRFPTRRAAPVRTIANDEGDRAELWSSGQDAQAAAGVLRRRLASMRRETGE